MSVGRTTNGYGSSTYRAASRRDSAAPTRTAKEVIRELLVPWWAHPVLKRSVRMVLTLAPEAPVSQDYEHLLGHIQPFREGREADGSDLLNQEVNLIKQYLDGIFKALPPAPGAPLSELPGQVKADELPVIRTFIHFDPKDEVESARRRVKSLPPELARQETSPAQEQQQQQQQQPQQPAAQQLPAPVANPMPQGQQQQQQQQPPAPPQQVPHGPVQPAPLAQAPPPRHVGRKRPGERCTHFLEGTCTHGNMCGFDHP